MRAISAFFSRSFISAAARLVNVTASTDEVSARPESTREMIFSTMTKVLPLPADAETSTCPSASIAALCSGVGILPLIFPFSF